MHPLVFLLGDIDHTRECRRFQEGIVHTEAADCNCRVIDIIRHVEGLENRLARANELLPAIIFAVTYFDFGEVGGPPWERALKAWEETWKPALEQEHFGDCTKQPQACFRCQAEDCMRLADIVRKGLTV